jgi:predicted kinase
MPKLYILCGIPCSGKSTWAKGCLMDAIHISRDEIRFSILKKGEEYFSHETEVYKEFIYEIAQTLMHGYDVIADATHINHDSRSKLTRAIDQYFTKYQIVYVVFPIDIEIAQDRNAFRTSLKHVPPVAIQTMYDRFSIPTLQEDERAIEVLKGVK